MKQDRSDPDIETIIGRIESGQYNLQPDFQRGEVWDQIKQQRLIDSILRKWHIPPIHLVRLKNGKKDVLDGQQRLVAIRDFVNGEFRINGFLDPSEKGLTKLDNRFFDELPQKIIEDFRAYSISIIEISDYRPEEPGELFFRLNMPTSLTPPEKRNAFYGPVRTSIKALVHKFSDSNINEHNIGFSNKRMAYDDVVARFAVTLENKTLAKKVLASDIESRYRSSEDIPKYVIDEVNGSLVLFAEVVNYGQNNNKVRFNKATLFSWLVFFMRYKNEVPEGKLDIDFLSQYLYEFEWFRVEVKKGNVEHIIDLGLVDVNFFGVEKTLELISLYNDVSSSRVNDVASILSRDVILWLFASISINSAIVKYPSARSNTALRLSNSLSLTGVNIKTAISKYIEAERDWGNLA